MQMGYWDGNRFVIPGLPQATPPSVTQPPQGIIPQANMVQSPVQQFQQRPSPPNMMGRGEDNGSDAAQPTGDPTKSGGPGYGQIGGTMGLMSGIPGGGLLGAGIGTGIDAYNTSQQMGGIGRAGPGVGDYLSGVLNNVSFGLLGTDVREPLQANGNTYSVSRDGGVVDDRTSLTPDELDARRAAETNSDFWDDKAKTAHAINATYMDMVPDDVADENAGADDSVICTELHRQGYETDEFMALDRKYGIRQPEDVMAGYHAWAKPLVRLMQRSRMVTQIVRFVSAPVRKAIAYQMGGNVWPPVTGIIMLKTGTWICRQISAVSRVIKSMTSGRTSPT